QPSSQIAPARELAALELEPFGVVAFVQLDTDAVLILLRVERAVELPPPRADEPLEPLPRRPEQRRVVGRPDEHHLDVVPVDPRRLHLPEGSCGPLEAFRSYSRGAPHAHAVRRA